VNHPVGTPRIRAYKYGYSCIRYALELRNERMRGVRKPYGMAAQPDRRFLDSESEGWDTVSDGHKTLRDAKKQLRRLRKGTWHPVGWTVVLPPAIDISKHG
jgi:hypothetical protein